MDLVPRSTDSTTPAERVPHLRLAEYDRLGFWEFLERSKTTQSALRDGQDPIFTRTKGYQESLIQEWLFFGTLHETTQDMGLCVSLNLFSKRSEDGRYWLSTECLKDFVREILLSRMPDSVEKIAKNALDQDGGVQTAERLAAKKELVSRAYMALPLTAIAKLTWLTSDKDENLKAGRRVQRCLSEVKKFLVLTHTQWANGVPESLSDLRSSILLSIQLLCSAITSIADTIYGAHEPRGYGYSSGINFGEMLRSRMYSKGWCPTQMENITHGNTEVCYYASTFPALDHEDHKSCLVNKCHAAYQANLRFSAMQHVSSCDGSCHIIQVDESEIVGILESGSYPVVVATIADEEVTLRICDKTIVDSFIAVSHVWSHGLGNPHQNAILKCQLDRLFTHVIAPKGSPLVFWLDTLAVPVSPWNRPARKLALNRLRSVYAEASTVMIVDRKLETVGEDICDRKFWLLCCDWTRRLWTLQEGLLPPVNRICVKFKHDLAPLQPMLEWPDFSGEAMKSTNIADPSTWIRPTIQTHTLWSQVSSILSSWLRMFFLKDLSRQDRLMTIVESLHGRTTTKIIDEPTCLATLMGVDLTKFPRQPSMAEVLAEMDLPEALLFVAGRRISSGPYSWAPQSFLSLGAAINYSRPIPLGRQTEHGFVVRKDSFALQGPVKMEFSTKIFVKDLDSRLRFIFFVPDKGDLWNNYESERVFNSPALLFELPLDDKKRHMKAVLVERNTVKEGIAHATYHFQVQLRCMQPGEEYTSVSMVHKDIWGSQLPMQQWCVRGEGISTSGRFPSSS